MSKKHFSLRLPDDLLGAVMKWSVKHSVKDFSEAVRELLRVALEQAPQRAVICRGIANRDEFEALLGRCDQLIHELRTVKLHLRKPLPRNTHDPDLHALVNKWRAQSEQALSELEKIQANMRIGWISLLGLNEVLAASLTARKKAAADQVQRQLSSKDQDPKSQGANGGLKVSNCLALG